MSHLLLWATAASLLVGLIAGVVADRFNRKRLLIASDLIRAVLVATLPLAAQAGFVTVCAVIALDACASACFAPARIALIPSAVRAGHLVAANAWFAASGFLTALIGTVVGSWLVTLAGLTMSLWVNAVVFVCSAVAVSLARIHAPTPGGGLRGGEVFRELRAGWKMLARHRSLRLLVLHYAGLMGVACAIYIGLVGFAGHHEDLGLRGVSWLLSAVVFGLISGGLLAHRLSRYLSTHRLIALGLVTIGIGSVGVAASHTLAAIMGWLLIIGAGGALEASVIEATLQRLIPDGLRGRVIAARGVVSGITVLSVSAGTGWAIDHGGTSALFGACGLLCGLGAFVMWLSSHHWFVRPVTRWLLRQLAFAYFRLSVSGLEHLPLRGPAILAANHPNVLDGILLMIISPRPVRFLVAEEFFFHPYLHALFTAFGCIPVYRTRPGNGEALRAAIAALRRGEVIGIFPEGTTTDRGRMTIVKRGVGLLALATGAAVVPVGIAGSAEVFPEGSRVPRPGTVAVAIAPAVFCRGGWEREVPAEVLQRVLEEVRWEILRAMRWAAEERLEQARPPVVNPALKGGVKLAQVALSSLVVVPLTGLLSVTANPSLDPGLARRGA